MDPIVIQTATNLSSDAAKGIFQEAKRHIRYAIIYKKNVNKFEEKLKTLMAKRASVQQQVDAAKRNVEKIKADVENWCNIVDKKIEEEEKKVKDLEDKANHKCFTGLCPNIKFRYQLSRKAEEGANTVDGLLQQAGEFNRVSYQDVPEDSVDRPPKDFEAFKSREKVFNDILEALKDATISIIGVFGMPGVGKTTLVNEVARQAKKDKLFDAVVMGVVNQTPDIQKIQNQIADSLGLKFEEQSVIGRARRLCERLKKEKNILVVLDDLWGRLDLREVGIPIGDEHEGCNILLTSRDLNVLSNGMDAQKNFPIHILEEKEAWDLFRKMVGDNTESPELRSTAIEVAKKCSGLPVAIATVARALRKKDVFAWNDALRKLRRPSPTNFTGIPAHVYSAIELSYNHLESEELKQTFLLCCLLGHDGAIKDLLKYSMGLGFFHGVDTVEETRDRLLTVVSDLKASCLLHDSYSNDRVDMHDLISDVAIAISSRDNKVFALKHDDVLKDWPDRETMEKCTMISLRYANISHFPNELKCPQLGFLYFGGKDSSVKIPGSFFRDMVNLKVLDLTKMHFLSLPSSISVLTNLRTLCLDQCVLEDIALIGELKNLESLSLLSSDIKMLPKEIGQLVKLKLLDLSGCTKLEKIPPGLLSSLSRLEELFMGGSFVQWEAERLANQQTNASLAELKLLSNLTTLEIHIPDAKIMPGELFSEKLTRYKIFIGNSWDWDGKHDYSRTLRLKLNRSINHLDYGIKMLLKKTEDLYLDDMNNGPKIALHGLLNVEGFQHLKTLHIQNCPDIQYIIDDKGPADKNEFHQLQCLTLENLPQLMSFSCENKRSSMSGSQKELPLFDEKMVFPCLENLHLSSINVERIWHHQLSSTSLCTHENLTSLIVEGCGNLKRLLSSSMARSLVNLKCFEIVDCKSLKEIIFSEEGITEEEVVLFPQLNSLKIKELQHLMGFCSENHKIEFSSLKLLEIEHCPALKQFMYKSLVEENQCFSSLALFDDKVAFPSLEKMRIAHLRNMKTIWHNQLPVNSFCKLTEIAVEHCDELLTLFPFDMWGTFQRLQTLAVFSCGSLVEVFEVPSLNMEEKQVVATRFKELYIYCLPKLRHIWSKDPRGILTFQNLRVVQVFDCWSLKNVFPASIARVLPQVKDLQISHCGVEEIISEEEGILETTIISFKFDQVSSLQLWNLPKLKCFYPGMHTTQWPMLKKLNAYHCNQVKIFDTNMSEDDGQLQDSLVQQPPPLFLVEKVLTKLEEVCLNSYDIAIVRDNNKFSGDRFHEMKVLKLLCYHDEQSAIFPITFLQKFNNLEKLEVICCEFEKLFSYGRGVGEEINAGILLPAFKSFRLNNVANLYYLWMQESGLDRLFPNLQNLEVAHCHHLISLGSSSAHFHNLLTLDVFKCERMINLVTSSSAVQSLLQLKMLKIRECASIKQVVGHEGGKSTANIIFNKLKCLELWNLPSLKSFCSSNYTFEFPSLEQVIVIQCTELEIFCKGVLNAPMLQRVQATEEDKRGYWVGDLNSTVQQLYTKKVGYQGVKYLVLSDFSKSIDIWKEKFHESLDFTNLQVLEVYDCSSLRYIFTISMALNLVQLNDLKVKNCSMLEEVITNEGAEEAKVSRIMLPRLQFITLESCLSLTSFVLGSNTMECPSLQQIIVADCPTMFEFTSAFPRMQDMETIGGVNAPFFNDKLLCPNLEYLKFSSLNIKKIWPDDQQEIMSFWDVAPAEEIPPAEVFSNLRILQVLGCGKLENNLVPPLVSFKNLTTLKVSKCLALKSLVTPQTAKSMMLLERMSVVDCHMMKEIIACTSDVVVDGIVFSKLKSLELDSLPNLSRFCSGNYTFGFPSLEHVIMKQCPKMEIFCEGELSTPMLQGIESTEGEYEGYGQGNLNAIIQQLFVEKTSQHGGFGKLNSR